MTFLKGFERFTNWTFLGELSVQNLSLLQNGAKKECVQYNKFQSGLWKIKKIPKLGFVKKNFNAKQIAYL